MNPLASLARSVRRSCHRMFRNNLPPKGAPAEDCSALLAESLRSAEPAAPRTRHGLNPQETASDDSLPEPRGLQGRLAPGHALTRSALLAALNHPVGDGHCRPWLDALVLDAPAAAVRAQVLEELSSLMVLAMRLPLAQVGQLYPGDRDKARELLDAMRDGIEGINASIGSVSDDRMASQGFDRIRGNLELISVCIWRARQV